jgi:ABC-type phosphate transport system substrate-binding protein
MILSVTLVSSIVLMLGGGVFLFDAVERETISIEAKRLNRGQVVCEGTRALLVPLESVGTMFSKVDNVSVEIGVCSDEHAIQRLLDGQIDVALTTRLPSRAERKLAVKKGLVLRPLVVANEELSVVVSIDNPNESITSVERSLVEQIFGSGNILAWDALVPNGKGEIQPLLIWDDGVSAAFMKRVSVGSPTIGDNVVQVGGSDQLLARVAENKSAIAIIPKRLIDDRVRELRVEWNDIEVTGNAGAMQRPLYMLVNAGAQSEPGRRFVEFTLSKLGQNVIRIDGLMSYRN